MRLAVSIRAVAIASLCAASLDAQTPRQNTQVEVRADAIAARWTTVQAGIGVTVPVGVYVRTGGVIAAGGGGNGFDSRLDLFSRFTLDPFRESRWGFYGGAGASGRYVEFDSPEGHVFLLIFAGIEGPLRNASRAGWVPAFEIGLGGGARVGFSLRQAIPGRR